MYVKKLADYKTGEIAKRAAEYADDDYWQVDIYAAALEEEFGKLPDEGAVVLIGRSGNAFAGEDLELTKEAEIIDRPISAKRCGDVLLQVQQVAEEISAYYTAYLKLIGDE